MTPTQEHLNLIAELYNLIRQIPNPEAIHFAAYISENRKRKCLMLPDGSYADKYRLPK